MRQAVKMLIPCPRAGSAVHDRGEAAKSRAARDSCTAPTCPPRKAVGREGDEMAGAKLSGGGGDPVFTHCPSFSQKHHRRSELVRKSSQLEPQNP